MKNTSWIFLAVFVTVVVTAWLIQANMLLSSDVAVLLDEAQRMLAGGKYVNDFFETNPPMAIYLYFPVCYLVKLTGLNLIIALRLYVFALGLGSIALSTYLLNKIITPKNRGIFYAWVLMLPVVLFLLPMYEFAQRENLFTILILPYLFAAVLASEKKSLPFGITLLIGVMAALGFALKPYFLVTLILIEGSFILKNKTLFAWVRVESLIILFLLPIYLASIFLFQPEYIHVMLPLIRHYYLGVHNSYSWQDIFTRTSVVICWVTGLFYLLSSLRSQQYRNLNWVFFLALVGMFASILLQKTPVFYYVMPALSLALLMLAGYFGQLLIANKSRENNLLIIFLLLFYLPLIQDMVLFNFHYIHAVQNPVTFSKLKTFINSHNGKHSIYCFSLTGTQNCYPLTILTHSEYAGRPPFMWWAQGLEKVTSSTALPAAQIQKDKEFLYNGLAEDLNRHQARWLLVNYIGMKKYLKENEKLRLALQNYTFVTRINDFTIYERRSEKLRS